MARGKRLSCGVSAIIGEQSRCLCERSVLHTLDKKRLCNTMLTSHYFYTNYFNHAIKYCNSIGHLIQAGVLMLNVRPQPETRSKCRREVDETSVFLIFLNVDLLAIKRKKIYRYYYRSVFCQN